MAESAKAVKPNDPKKTAKKGVEHLIVSGASVLVTLLVTFNYVDDAQAQEIRASMGQLAAVLPVLVGVVASVLKVIQDIRKTRYVD